MFERFTDGARRAIVLTKEEALALNHSWIGTEHLLLGLLRVEDGTAARALTSLGVSRDAARQAVEAIVPRGAEPPPPSGHIPFTPRAKKVLEFSLREAMQLGSGYIGTEHILLGLLREGDGVGAQVLIGFGVHLDRARRQVAGLLHGTAGEPAPAPAAPARWPADDELVDRLASVAARLEAIERRLGQSPPG